MAIFSIRNFVKKQMMKTNDQGIVNMPSDMKLDFGEAVITKTLLDAGIDPRMIKNDKQLEAVLDSIDKMMRDAAKPVDKGIKSTQSAKVFNLQGEELDPSKPIIGGTQQGKKINRETFSRLAERGSQLIKQRIADRKINEVKDVKQRIDSGVAATIEKMLAMEPIDAMKEANKVIKREGPYKNLTQQDAKKILQDTEDHIFERNVVPKETDMDFDDDGFAEGGRIGFKKGMTRRKFLEIMAGIGASGAAVKTGLLKLMGKEKAAPVVEKAAEVLGGGTPPPYFFNLVKKIKNLGDDVTNVLATNERQKVTKYKDYELTEDLVTGEQTIQRIKMSDHQYYDENLAEEVYMNYKPGKGQTDEATGAKVADEYTEDTGYLRTSGPQKGDLYDSESGVPKDVIEEGTVFEDNVTDFETKEKTKKIKKAEGGRIPFVFGGGIFKAVIQNLAKEKGVSPSEYLRIANYKALPDSVKRFMSEAEFLKLKETMTGKRIEMVENVRDMIQSRLAFNKSKADLAASMNKASPGYGDAAVKMMFPEGSFKSPVPAGAGEKDVMMMEQLIKNLQTKGRKENASGGLAGMLGE